MAIVQISKMQQRAGNLVDLPQLDNGELGWASDANRLFIGRTGSTYSSENIEVLTSYSTVSLSQISGSDGGNLNINAAENGQILTYVSSTNTWENYTGNSDQLSGGKLNLGDPANITMAGGAIGYVLQTDGTGNLSWTGQTGGSGGGGSPGGANTSVQFNDAGVFGGSANLSFNKTTRVLNVNGNVIANNFVGNLANGTTSIRISPTSGNLTFTTNGSTVMTVSTGSNVGIGTSSPAQKLEVSFSDTTTNRTNPVNVAAITATSTITGGAVFTGFGPALVFRSQSYDGTVYNGPRVRMVIGDNSISTTAGSSLAFDITATKGASPTQAAIIDSGGNVGIGTSSPSAPLDVNGNVAITGSARRITGDFSNATIASRAMFQSSTVNGSTVIGFIPNGTSVSSQLALFANSDPTNTSFLQIVSNTTEAKFAATITGTGTYLPMTFYTGGSERMRLDTSGRVLVGSPTARANLFNGTSTSPLQVEGTTADNSTVLAVRNTDTAAAGPFYILARARGTTVGSTTVVQSGDAVGTLSFQASDGTEFVETARIQSIVDGAPGANDMPGALLFSTTADGAAASTERMRISSAGDVGIGTDAPGSKLDVRSGFITSGNATSTNGTKILAGYYSSGHITTFGSEYSSGGPVLGYGVWPSTSALGAFVSSSLTNLYRGAYTIAGNTHLWYGGTQQNVAVDSPVIISELMQINGDGNVGIGTSYASSRLVVNGGTSTSQIRWEVNNAAYTQEVSTNAAQDAYVYKSNDASYHVWKISSTTAMTLDSNSRLLINIATSKTYGGQLQVLNNIQAIGGSSADSPLIASYDFDALDASPTYSSAVLRKFGSTAAGNLYFASTIPAPGWAEIGGINVQSGVAFGANNAVPVIICTNGAERMRINSSGRLGVGVPTINTGFIAQFNGDVGLGSPTRNQTTTALIGVRTSDDPADDSRSSVLFGTTAGAASSDSYIALNTNKYGVSGGERVRIDPAGNVGIGTNLPSAKLDIYGGSLGGTLGDQIIIERLFTYNANESFLDFSAIRDAAGTSWETAGSRLQQKIDSTWMSWMQFNGNDNRGGVAFGTGTSTAGPLNVVERMRINDSGNVGIGTNAPGYTLDVRNSTTSAARFGPLVGGATIISTSANQGIWAGGCEWNGSAFVARSTQSSQIRTDLGLISIFTDTGLTANSTFVPTERMRINANGAIALGSVGSISYGTSGQVLTSGGENNEPTWTTVASGSGTVTSVSGTGTVNGISLGGTVTTTGSLTLSGSLSGSLSGCTVDGTNPVGFLNIPQNSQNQYYTCVLADAGKHIYHPPGGGSGTFEIPPNSSVSYPLGTAISFVNLGSIQNITCADTVYLAGTGTTGVRVLAQYGTATALKVAATTWIISGTGLT